MDLHRADTRTSITFSRLTLRYTADSHLHSPHLTKPTISTLQEGTSTIVCTLENTDVVVLRLRGWLMVDDFAI